MNIPEGDRRHCSLCAIRATLAETQLNEVQRALVEETAHIHQAHRPLTRDEKIDLALSNLNASTNHRTTRETVAAAYDRLHPNEEKT